MLLRGSSAAGSAPFADKSVLHRDAGERGQGPTGIFARQLVLFGELLEQDARARIAGRASVDVDGGGDAVSRDGRRGDARALAGQT